MFKAGFSWLSLASFEVSSYTLHLHHIIAIMTNLLSKVTYNTFFGVFTLDFVLSKTYIGLSFA